MKKKKIIITNPSIAFFGKALTMHMPFGTVTVVVHTESAAEQVFNLLSPSDSIIDTEINLAQLQDVAIVSEKAVQEETEVCLRESCEAARSRIVLLEKALREIIELPSVRQDECCCLAMTALDSNN
jgi:hypothetical protein